MSKPCEPIVFSGTSTEYPETPEGGDIIRRRILQHPGRLEKVLASAALFVLRLMRPKLLHHHVRLEWFCTCGVHLYADYPDSGDIAEFQKSLGYTQKRYPSFTQLLGDGRHTKMFQEALFSLMTARFARCVIFFAMTARIVWKFEHSALRPLPGGFESACIVLGFLVCVIVTLSDAHSLGRPRRLS